MTKAELIEKIRKGCDIMFDVMGRHFTILVDDNLEFLIDEQHPNDGNERHFETAKDLVENYEINGISLENLSRDVIITNYTLSGVE